MEIQEALDIVRALANGLNPETKEAMETASTWQQPRTIMALNRALAALVQQEQREKNKPVNAGRKWTRQEDAEGLRRSAEGHRFPRNCPNPQRTVGSIVARLVKLGKIAAAPPRAA